MAIASSGSRLEKLLNLLEGALSSMLHTAYKLTNSPFRSHYTVSASVICTAKAVPCFWLTASSLVVYDSSPAVLRCKADTQLAQLRSSARLLRSR